MRSWHYLPRNFGNPTVHEAIWLDCETLPDRDEKDNIRHRLWFGWLARRRRLSPDQWTEAVWHRFSSIPEAWEIITGYSRADVKLHVYSHNVAFDFVALNVFQYLPKNGWKLRSAIIESPPTILTFSREKKKLVILDTLNWWRCSAEKLGEIIGFEKLPFPSPEDPQAVWDRYCRRDVEIIMVSCLRWYDFLISHRLGGHALTLAGQSFRSYRHRFLKTPILIDGHPKATPLSRSSYIGGRCECFRLGKLDGSFHMLDVNSMYPAVMAQYRYPIGIQGYTRRCSVLELETWLKSYSVVADVEIQTDQPAFPFRQGKKLLFPVGKFRTILTTPELQYAVDRKQVLKVYRVALYHHADIFSEDVFFFFSLRQKYVQEKNPVYEEIAKKLQNSLYGKFGQMGRKYLGSEWIEDLTPRVTRIIDAETKEVWWERQLGGLKQTLKNEPESRHSFPAIASHVTAYARMKLWSYLQKAGRENVFYCDTDSLVVNDGGMARLQADLQPGVLGKLKLEGSWTTGEIIAPKMYRFGEKIRMKGIRKSATWLARDEVVQESWPKLKRMILEGDVSVPRTYRINKKLRLIYEKGRVMEDGSVHPFVLPDDSDFIGRL